MKPILFLLLFLAGLGMAAPDAGAQSRTVIWLGPAAPATQSRLTAAGLFVLPLACGEGDVRCIRKGISRIESNEPPFLIADTGHSETVRILLNKKISARKLGGIVLLRAGDGDLHKLKAARNAPKLFVIAERNDPQETIVRSRLFASEFRKKGVAATFLMVEAGALNRRALHPITVGIIGHFMGNRHNNETLAKLLDATVLWQDPPFAHDDFFKHEKLIATRTMTPDLKELIDFHYNLGPERYLEKQWPLETFEAFDLMAYRDKVAPDARYATLKNRRGQIVYLDLEAYGPYEPEIVVGIDGERNLFRFAWFYRFKAMYTWKPEKPEISVRLLGPILVFQKPLPSELSLPIALRTSFLFDGIEFSESSPLAPTADYPAAIKDIVTQTNQCINCHAIGVLGGRAHHIVATTGEPQGGFALPLSEYPDEVIDAFLTDQETVAAKIGVLPNPLPEDLVAEFDAWVKGLED